MPKLLLYGGRKVFVVQLKSFFCRGPPGAMGPVRGGGFGGGRGGFGGNRGKRFLSSKNCKTCHYFDGFEKEARMRAHTNVYVHVCIHM
jgi:hypothetical protein